MKYSMQQSTCPYCPGSKIDIYQLIPLLSILEFFTICLYLNLSRLFVKYDLDFLLQRV